MSKRIDQSSRSPIERLDGRHRFEYWSVDNQVYFITARCRDRFVALASDRAKHVFWDRFDHYAHEFQFTPWVTTVLDNHYHALGHLKHGQNLRFLMQRLHGSVAKLVNDLLPERRSEFWRDSKGREYFDGCIRDEQQCRRAYRYTLTQSVRHGRCADWREYPHTHVGMEMNEAVVYAHRFGAFMPEVPYPRYRTPAKPA